MAKPTEAELREMAFEHVTYEVQMLQRARQGIQWVARQDPARRGMLQNLLLESFLVHARNLIYFFYRDSDVHAGLYAKGWGVPKSTTLDDARRRANKQLAHLTLERIKYKPKRWDTSRIYAELMATYAAFLTVLTPERRLWFPADPARDLG